MIAVSTAFNIAASATVRKARARVEVSWADANLDAVDVTANETNRSSGDHPVDDTLYLSQAADGIMATTRKWAVLGEMVADGTYHAQPTTEAQFANSQVGWLGESVSDGSGGYSAPLPALTVDFLEPRPVYHLHVSGDTSRGEYPRDFEVRLYDESDVLLYTETVTNNTLVEWEKSIADEGIDNARKMTLEISRWSKAGAVVKIAEFFSTLTEVYEGDDILSFSLLEESETVNGSLPIGNISANELDLRLQNVEDRFFPGNTRSPIHPQIKRGRKIRAWLGFELPSGATEYVPLGVFWSGDWDVPEMGTHAQTSALDRMEQLRKANFERSEVYEGIDLYDLAEIVLNDAKIRIPDLTWSIGDELKDFVIPVAWFPRQSYFECIRQIVVACMGWAYVDRAGVLVIVGRAAAAPKVVWQDTADVANTPMQDTENILNDAYQDNENRQV